MAVYRYPVARTGRNGYDPLSREFSSAAPWVTIYPTRSGHYSWSADRKLVAMFQKDVFIVDVEQGGLQHQLHGDSEKDLVSVEFSPDGRRIAACSSEGLLKVWDVRTGMETVNAPHGGWKLAWSPNGDQIALSFGGVNVIDSSTGRIVQSLPNVAQRPTGSVASLAWTPEGNKIVASNNRFGIVYDVEKGVIQRQFPLPAGTEHGLSISPDGRLAAALATNTLSVRGTTAPAR